MKKRFRQWFGGRMPRGDVLSLNQRSTYILPTKVGFLIVGVVVLMMIGATNYQNNLAFLLTFLLTGIGLVTIIFTVKNLQEIEFSLNKSDEVFAGEPLAVSISLRSKNIQPHFCIGVGFEQTSLMLTDVPANGFSKITLKLDAPKRGLLYLPRFTATSRYPFGWLKAWGYFSFERPFVVYPKPIEPNLFERQASGKETDEGLKVEGNEDLYGLRSYQAGESLSRIDWKAFARERGLFVREFVQYQSSRLSFSWNDFPGVAEELRLSYLTFQVLQAASQNLHYSLELPNISINFADGEAHRIRCLEALALFGENNATQAERT